MNRVTRCACWVTVGTALHIVGLIYLHLRHGYMRDRESPARAAPPSAASKVGRGGLGGIRGSPAASLAERGRPAAITAADGRRFSHRGRRGGSVTPLVGRPMRWQFCPRLPCPPWTSRRRRWHAASAFAIPVRNTCFRSGSRFRGRWRNSVSGGQSESTASCQSARRIIATLSFGR